MCVWLNREPWFVVSKFLTYGETFHYSDEILLKSIHLLIWSVPKKLCPSFFSSDSQHIAWIPNPWVEDEGALSEYCLEFWLFYLHLLQYEWTRFLFPSSDQTISTDTSRLFVTPKIFPTKKCITEFIHFKMMCCTKKFYFVNDHNIC